MKAEQPGQDCSCGFIRAGTSDVQRKPRWVDGPGQEQADDVSAEELSRVEEMIPRRPAIPNASTTLLAFLAP